MPKIHVSFTGRTVISGGYSSPGDDFFPGYGVVQHQGQHLLATCMHRIRTVRIRVMATQAPELYICW